MARFSHKLPAVLSPIGDICVQVLIPAHPDYVALFIRAVRMLEINHVYERDEGLSAITVVDNWRKRTITPLIEALATGTGACGLDGECLAYPPFANFISYFPQNPYTEPDLIPDGFLAPPFYVNGKDNEHTIPTHEIGDVIVNFAAINLEPSWNLDNTPRIELCLTGSGVADIHFLNIVQGGIAIISVDNPVDLGDILAGIIGDSLQSIDLNQDIISLPPESTEEIIIPVEVETEGDHIIYIYFLPVVNDSLIPLSFGGAIREISLCGNLRPCGMPAPEPPPPLEGVTELKPEFQFTADCGLEIRYRNQDNEIISDWEAVAGWIENFADCVGGVNMATKDDIRDGIYEAFNRLSAQIVSGRYTDILVGDDGTVTDPTTGGDDAGLPEDDPATTTINEEFAAKTGGVRRVTDGLQKILTDMHTWFAGYTAPSTGVIPQMAEDRLVNLYGFDPTKANVLVNYWYTVYMNASGAVTLNELVLDGFFFCRGASIQTLAHYVYNSHADQNEVPVLEVFLENVPLEQMQAWYSEGVETPSQEYYQYSCVPIENETFVLDMSTAEAPQAASVQNLKINHRYKFTVSGTFTDTDNPDLIGDFFYVHDTNLGTKTYRGTNPFNSAGMNQPSSSQVPYRADGIYTVIVDKVGAANPVIVSRDNSPMNLPNTTGLLTIVMEDLGEFSL